jgi:hypothetical protein
MRLGCRAILSENAVNFIHTRTEKTGEREKGIEWEILFAYIAGYVTNIQHSLFNNDALFMYKG